MASPRRRSHAKPTLSATDEFWHAPMPEDLPPGTIDSGDDSDGVAAAIDADEDDRFEGASLPPAHRQLLSSDPAYAVDLKGCDHDSGDGCAGDDRSSCFSRRGPFPANRQSGGSWLMGFVRWDKEPGLVEVPGWLSLKDSDECSSSSDDDSLDSLQSDSRRFDPSRVDKPTRRGVTFNPSVVVRPIPHSSTYSSSQRQRMYSTALEVRRNKARNKREFRHDGCDWREATEEWEMDIDMVTGELVHPAHKGC